MPSKTIPLVGQPNQRGIYGYTALSADKDQIFESVLITTDDNPVTQSRKVWAEKRPGWALNSTPSAGNRGVAVNVGTLSCRAYGAGPSLVYIGSILAGSTDSSDTVTHITEAVIGGENVVLISAGGGYFVANGATSSTTFSGNRTSGSAVLTGVTVTSDFYIGQALGGTGIATGARVLSYDAGASTVTMTLAATSGAATATTVSKSIMAKIIDADFLGTVGGFVEMDGYVFTVTGDRLKVQHSDLNSIINWSASSYVSANQSSDTLYCAQRIKNQILAMGTRSIEFFYNAGNPSGAVISRTDQSIKNIGVVESRAAFTINDQMFFCGRGLGPQSGVWMMDGFNAKKISTPAVDRILRTYELTTVDAFMFGGQTMVHVAQGDGTNYYLSLLYNVDTGVWVNSGFPFHFRISGGGDSDRCSAVPLNSTSGKTYIWEPDAVVYRDDGAAYSLIIQTGRVDFETEARKFINKVSLIGADIQSSGTVTLEYSDDDYATWTVAGVFDLTKINPFITRCGSHQSGRAWRLTHSANTAFRAQSLKFDYSVGAH